MLRTKTLMDKIRIAIYALLVGSFVGFGMYTLKNIDEEPQALGAATINYQKDIIPVEDSRYYLGTTSKAWLSVITDEVCLSGDCQTTWPAGGGGGIASTTPWTVGDLLQLDASGAVKTIATSSLGITSSQWTTSGSNIYYSTGNVGIGTTTPAYALDVVGTINASSTYRLRGTQMAYLPDQSDFIGSSFFGTGGASLTRTSGSDGRYNTSVGIGADKSVTTGYNNTAFGYNAMEDTTTGTFNVAIGANSLFQNTTGSNNMAIGDNSLGNSLANSSSVGIGVQAGLNATSTGATFIGHQAGRATAAYNVTGATAIGFQAGYGGSGDYGTLIGYRAGFGLTGGTTNVLVGYQAGDNVTNGDNNIVLGANIDAPSATGNNQLNIGNIIFGTGVSGTGSTIAGNIGIGTTTPSTTLQVFGTTTTSVLCLLNDTCRSTWPSGGSGLTSLNGQTGGTQTFATGTATGIGLTITSGSDIHTFIPTVSSGYNIPLTASTTEWAAASASTTALTPAYIRSLFSATSPLAYSAGNFSIANVPTTTISAPGYSAGYMLIASTTAPGGWAWVATSTLGISGGGSGGSTTTINGASGPSFTFATGSSGTNFNIATSSGTVTFNIPDASASNRGLVTTGAQTFAGDKTFSGNIQYQIATSAVGVYPDANDGATLGISGLGWSDLFLASGGVLDWAGGNTSLTHSSGVLTLNPGDLRITSPGANAASVVTVGGTQTLTNKTLATTTVSGPITSTYTGTSTFAGNVSIAGNLLVTGALEVQGALGAALVALIAAAIAAYTVTFSNKNIDADNNTVSNLEVDNFKGSAVVTESEGLASSDNDTSFPTTAAVKDYVDGNLGGSTDTATPNAGATINGATLPVPVYQNKTDNEVYACDANNTSAMKFIGFAVSNSTDGNPIDVQVTGVVGGFSGLDEGEKYYVQDTAGTIGTTIGTYEILVGVAISTTELVIQKGKRRAAGHGGGLGTASGSLGVTCGFRPSVVRIDAMGGGSANFAGMHAVWVNGSIYGVNANYNEATTGTSANGANISGGTAGNSMAFTITSVTDTGFTVTWTESGTFPGAAEPYFMWEAEGEL